MEKRPVSLTVIAVILIILSLFGLVGIFMIGKLPGSEQALQQMHVSLVVLQAMGVVGAIVNLICAYGIFKGLPWSRVLYVAWGVIGLVFSVYSAPAKAGVVVSLIILVVISIFLWTNAANDWFQARGLMLSREARRG
jgi:uncharacterized membrane protein (DUF2068 family)